VTKNFRLIILGAGFSRPAGYPLAKDLWETILSISKGFSSSRRESKFNDDLRYYLKFLEDAKDIKIKPESINFEQFMSHLDREHFLGLRGGDTWSDEGNEGTIVVKTLIGHILANQLVTTPSIPELYLEFARRLQPSDYIITFNYDILLERALDAVGKPYRLFPNRYKSIGPYSGIVDDRRDEVVILKVHGSIDWFDKKNFNRRVQEYSEQGASSPKDLIFSNEEKFGVEPLVDGPRLEHDSLQYIHRVRHIEALYSQPLMFLATPRLLSPSTDKIIYSNTVGNLWEGVDSAGTHNLSMAIIGFSLPPQDEYSLQIFYSMIRNYQFIEWDTEILGRKKSPLVLVDKFSCEAEEVAYRERYRFVDWKKSTLLGNGFNEQTLDVIFS